jgi:uncharacterized protein involved in outer membrane biogenesis
MRRPWPWVIGALALAVLITVGLHALKSGLGLRNPLEARLSETAGALVRVEGPISIRLADTAEIALRKVHLTTRAVAQAPELASIEEMRVTVDLRQLRHGRLVIPEINFVRPIINLVRDEQGRVNWSIGSDEADDTGDLPNVGRVIITDGKLSYKDVPRHTSLDGTVRSDGESLVIDGAGTYRDRPSTVRITGGTALGLLESAKPYRLSANATAGATTMAASGTVTHPFATIGLDLDIVADGQNAQELFPILGIPAPPTPAYHLTGKLNRAGVWQLDSFAATVGDSDLAGSLRFETRRDRLFVSGSLTSKSLDIQDLGLIVGADGRNMAIVKPALRDVLLPDAPLNLDEVRDADVDVTLAAGRLLAQKLPLEDVDAHIRLDNARLTLAPMRVGVAGGRIDANLTIDARKDDVTTDYDIRFKDFQIERFLRNAGILRGSGGTVEGRIAVRGKGDSLQRSLASADGQANMFVDGATIDSLTADIVGLDVMRALGLLVTGSRRVPVRCLVADFTIKSGVMTPETLLLETDTTLVTGIGRIDLGSDRLDLELTSVPRHARSLALGTPISIGGTLQEPRVGLTAGTVALGTASAALGIVLSPLGAISDLVGGSGSRNVDCAALKRKIAARMPALPAQDAPGTTPPTR